MGQTCLIEDVYLGVDTGRVGNEHVRVYTGNIPAVSLNGGMLQAAPKLFPIDANGAYSIRLQRGDQTIPPNTTMVLAFPSGEEYGGIVPPIDGPVNLPTLQQSHGWGPVKTTQRAQIVTGPPGLVNRRAWSSSTQYNVNDLVTYQGSAFVALAINTNVTPVDGATWQQLVTAGGAAFGPLSQRPTPSVGNASTLYANTTQGTLERSDGTNWNQIVPFQAPDLMTQPRITDGLTLTASGLVVTMAAGTAYVPSLRAKLLNTRNSTPLTVSANASGYLQWNGTALSSVSGSSPADGTIIVGSYTSDSTTVTVTAITSPGRPPKWRMIDPRDFGALGNAGATNTNTSAAIASPGSQTLTLAGTLPAGVSMSWWTPITLGVVSPATKPTAALTAGGTLTIGASYLYKVSYLYGAQESALSSATVAQVPTSGQQTVSLTAIPTGGAGCTARNIYRQTTSGTFNLIGTLNNNTVTTFTDAGLADGAAFVTSLTEIVYPSAIQRNSLGQVVSFTAAPTGTYNGTTALSWPTDDWEAIANCTAWAVANYGGEIIIPARNFSPWIYGPYTVPYIHSPTVTLRYQEVFPGVKIRGEIGPVNSARGTAISYGSQITSKYQGTSGAAYVGDYTVVSGLQLFQINATQVSLSNGSAYFNAADQTAASLVTVTVDTPTISPPGNFTPAQPVFVHNDGHVTLSTTAANSYNSGGTKPFLLVGQVQYDEFGNILLVSDYRAMFAHFDVRTSGVLQIENVALLDSSVTTDQGTILSTGCAQVFCRRVLFKSGSTYTWNVQSYQAGVVIGGPGDLWMPTAAQGATLYNGQQTGYQCRFDDCLWDGIGLPIWFGMAAACNTVTNPGFLGTCGFYPRMGGVRYDTFNSPAGFNNMVIGGFFECLGFQYGDVIGNHGRNTAISWPCITDPGSTVALASNLLPGQSTLQIVDTSKAFIVALPSMDISLYSDTVAVGREKLRVSPTALSGTVKTTLSGTAASKQKILNVVDGTQLAPNQNFILGNTLWNTSAGQEVCTVASISGNAITLKANLINTHNAGEPLSIAPYTVTLLDAPRYPHQIGTNIQTWVASHYQQPGGAGQVVVLGIAGDTPTQAHFATVDEQNNRAPGPVLTLAARHAERNVLWTASTTAVSSPGAVQITLSPQTDMAHIVPGTPLLVDPGTAQQEVVFATAPAIASGFVYRVTATFANTHPAGFRVVIYAPPTYGSQGLRGTAQLSGGQFEIDEGPATLGYGPNLRVFVPQALLSMTMSPTAPTAAPGGSLAAGGTLVNGLSYSYKYSNVYANASESALSPASGAKVATSVNGTVNLTAVAVGPAVTLARNIYRNTSPNAAPTATRSAGSGLTTGHTFTYKFSYTIGGQESILSLASVQFTAQAGQAQAVLSAIQAGPATVTAYNIYRSESGGPYSLVQTQATNANWTDTGVAAGAVFAGAGSPFYAIGSINSGTTFSDTGLADGAIYGASGSFSGLVDVTFGTELKPDQLTLQTMVTVDTGGTKEAVLPAALTTNSSTRGGTAMTATFAQTHAAGVSGSFLGPKWFQVQASDPSESSTAQQFALGNTPAVTVPRPNTTDLRQALIDIGALASGGATPLNLNGGTLTAQALTLPAQGANTVFAGGAGGSAVPVFRGLVANDIPAVNPSALTGSGLVPIAGLPVATNSALGISRPDGASITSVAGVLTVLASGGPPTGAAGGDLGGSYPIPTVVNLSHVVTPTLTAAGIASLPTHVSTHALNGTDPLFFKDSPGYRGGTNPNATPTIENMRGIDASNSSALTSGTLFLNYVRATFSATITGVAISVAATVATSITVAQVTLYTVDVSGGANDGNLTLVAVSTNDTTGGSGHLFGTLHTTFQAPFASSYAVTAGTLYAVGLIYYTASSGTAPTVCRCVTPDSAYLKTTRTPPLASQLAGFTAALAVGGNGGSISFGSLANGTQVFWVALY